MATESKVSLGKVKSSYQDGSSKERPDSSDLNKKKINSSTKLPPKSSSAVTKTEVKSKTTSSSSKITLATTTRVREEKVFILAGQKHDPPEEREPLRYSTDHCRNRQPTSEMAEFWMMEHGLLSPDGAKKAYQKKQRKQKQLRMGTPTKSSQPLSNKPENSQKQQEGSQNGDVRAKRRVGNDTDDDDDFFISPKKRKG